MLHNLLGMVFTDALNDGQLLFSRGVQIHVFRHNLSFRCRLIVPCLDKQSERQIGYQDRGSTSLTRAYDNVRGTAIRHRRTHNRDKVQSEGIHFKISQALEAPSGF
jgi:hypothetical protein